jgi:hypothetical protein
LPGRSSWARTLRDIRHVTRPGRAAGRRSLEGPPRPPRYGRPPESLRLAAHDATPVSCRCVPGDRPVCPLSSSNGASIPARRDPGPTPRSSRSSTSRGGTPRRFAHPNRNGCWPSPTIASRSRQAISMRKRSATVVRMSATGPDASVQRNARHPVSTSTSTTRIGPPAGRRVARSVLYRLTVGSPYEATTSAVRPRGWPTRLARSMRRPPRIRGRPRRPSGRGSGTVLGAASLRCRLTMVIPGAIAALRKAALAYSCRPPPEAACPAAPIRSWPIGAARRPVPAWCGTRTGASGRDRADPPSGIPPCQSRREDDVPGRVRQ